MNLNQMENVLRLGRRVMNSPLRYGVCPKMPLKEYEGNCLYLAVMDERLTRQRTGGAELSDPSKRILDRYQVFLEQYRDFTSQELRTEVERVEGMIAEAGVEI